MKSSQQRAVRQKLTEQLPKIEPWIDSILPKKEKGLSVRCAGHITLVASEAGEPLFFQTRDTPLVPTLRTLHKYPFLLPVLKVDHGAVKHVINGADVMVPGIRGVDDAIQVGSVVGIFAEGKQHAIAVGISKYSAAELRNRAKGIAVENSHYLGDGLWKTPSLY